MSRKLVITDGTRERELQLVGRLVVGRDPTCDISDDHSLLSRRHAEFVTAGEAVTVRDLGSRNGVFVNGARAAERALQPGDVVQIGPLRARYVVDDVPLSIVPEVLDGDRTAMLRKPAGAATAIGPVPPVTPTPPAPALADTVVPLAPVDEDVTRMVPGPAFTIPEGTASSGDEEVTRFTPAPLHPDLTAVINPLGPLTAAPAAGSGSGSDAGLNNFVVMQSMILAAAVVVASLVAPMIAPGVPAVLLSLAVGLVAAFLVAGTINRRVGAVLDRAGRDRS